MEKSERYIDYCVTHAARIAELLLAEGKSPWVGRIHERHGDFVAPLIPTRFKGNNARTWTTHYVACDGRDVYDPIVGSPIVVDEYAIAVFGRPLDVQTHLDAAETRRLVSGGKLYRRLASPHLLTC